MTQNIQQRRADLDWLRISAFAILILYHTGMFYVADWGWHVKNATTYEWLQDLMKLTNPWRMSLLFLLGGMALAIVRPNQSAWRLAQARTSRLLVPLLFGMVVVVAPQAYYQAQAAQLMVPSYPQFWLEYINPHTTLLPEMHTPLGLLTWNHLWFLPYLWLYSVLVLPLHHPLQALATRMQQWPLWGLLLCLLVLHITALWTLREAFPSSHALVDDWYNHAKYGLSFLTGYLLVLQGQWWQRLAQLRWASLAVALVGYGLVVLDNHDVFDDLDDTNLWLQLTYSLCSVLNHWAWLATALGFAATYWQHPMSNNTAFENSSFKNPAYDNKDQWRRYASKAILPWYMLHQTLIVVLAVKLQTWQLPDGIEALLLIVGTVAGCALGYEVLRRIPLLSWLIGAETWAASIRISKTTQPAVLPSATHNTAKSASTP